jgi:DNA-binding protein YbaB
MMKQMQKMQKKMAQEQEKLKEERVAGTAGGGMVTCIFPPPRIISFPP